MEAVAMYPSNSFNHSMNSVQTSISELMRPQAAYRTSEIDRELRAIDNGISHIKLDNKFINDSPGWRSHFTDQELNNHRAALTSALGRGTQFMSTYRGQMTPQSVSGMQDNQVREQHHWAVQNLQGMRQEIHPFANNSHQRIQQFSDWVGVTDRFTGYRHNLSRPNERLQYQPYWRRGPEATSLTKQVKFATEVTPQRTSTSQRFNTRSKSAPPQADYTAVRRQVEQSGSHRAYPTRSIQEQAGIVTKYPGVSEYKEIFKRPATAVAHDYRINPTPDFGIIGRPLLPVEVDKKITEYGFRYDWPDGGKIESTPWNRCKKVR